MQAIQIEAFGNPPEVMKLVDIPDVGGPGEGEVVIALEASPINMSDLLMISGRYGYRPKLPSVMGTEGVGRVIAVGSGVKHLKRGDRTLVPFPAPAWAERIKVDASRLRPLPGGDVNQLAMLGINPPTAYLMLTDFVTLPSGSWVIQNSANSGVGRALIPIAKSLGLISEPSMSCGATTSLPSSRRSAATSCLSMDPISANGLQPRPATHP
jgi:NADPH:quinone reductase-like Zn-dependent oxidoreductase